MPNTKSAKKALRKSDRRHERNIKRNKVWKNDVKKMRGASPSDKNATEKKLANAYKSLDKAAKARTIHPNRASRLKSRLAKYSLPTT